MLKVFIELWPYGNNDNKKTLHEITIANDGDGTVTRGNYKVKFNNKQEWLEKMVINFPRQSYTAERLLYEVLKKKYG